MSITETITTVAVTAERWDGDGPPFWPAFLFWLLLAAGIVASVIYHRRRNQEAPRRAGEARLAEMYAAGEISDEDYRARRSVLREK